MNLRKTAMQRRLQVIPTARDLLLQDIDSLQRRQTFGGRSVPVKSSSNSLIQNMKSTSQMEARNMAQDIWGTQNPFLVNILSALTNVIKPYAEKITPEQTESLMSTIDKGVSAIQGIPHPNVMIQRAGSRAYSQLKAAGAIDLLNKLINSLRPTVRVDPNKLEEEEIAPYIRPENQRWQF